MPHNSYIPTPENAEFRIALALRMLDHYAARQAYGDAVLFAKAALLGKTVDEILDADE